MRARVTSTHTEQVSINVLRGDESLLCEEGVPCFARRMCLAMRAGVCLAEECVLICEEDVSCYARRVCFWYARRVCLAL